MGIDREYSTKLEIMVHEKYDIKELEIMMDRGTVLLSR